MPSATDLELDTLIQRIRDSAVASAAGNGPDGNVSWLGAGSFDELLASGSDVVFVDACYITIFRREPDPAGKSEILERLREGVRRTLVITQLLGSPEAKALGARLPGTGMAVSLNALAQRLSARPATRSLGVALIRGYSSWRHFRLALNGQGLRRNARIADCMHAHGRKEAERLSGELQALQHEASRALQRAEQRYRACEADVQMLRLRLAQYEGQLNKQNGKVVAVQQQMARLSAPAAMNSASAPVEPTRAQAEQSVTAVRLDADLEGKLTARLDAYYVAFEDAHRGSEDYIRGRLGVYLERLATLSASALAYPVLDIGCGRGEWIKLLEENGFKAIGVDLNRDMIEHCRLSGLQAHHRDALDWLSAQPDESVAVISAFHVVEHLPFAVLFQLIEQARRALIPGGLLVLETPNPENVLVGSHTFYHDFSHRNPVTPVSLQFLLEYHGFAVNELLRLHPYPPEARLAGDSEVVARVNGHFCGPQDYGVVAAKPAKSGEDQRASSGGREAT